MLKKIKPYLALIRLNQPAGIFLLLFPCLISLNMASRGKSDITLVIVFIIGSILMRSAGCIINDLADQSFDKHVKRTKQRPITSGVISRSKALKVLVGLFIAALPLLFFLKIKAILLCMVAIPLIIIYPYCKRYTYFAQLWLGLTYNLGVLIAWFAVQDQLSSSPIFLYLAMIFWTLGYDTIYAHQDKDDDLRLGLKSTAIYFGEKTEKYLNLFYTLMVTFIIFAFGMLRAHLPFYALMSVPVGLLFWQISSLDINDRNNCAFRFKLNIFVGATIYLASFVM